MSLVYLSFWSWSVSTIKLHEVHENSCACCCSLFSRDNNGITSGRDYFQVFSGFCCLESKTLRYLKEDAMLETMRTTGLYLVNHCRRAHLYQSNHLKKTLLKKTNRRKWMLIKCWRKWRRLDRLGCFPVRTSSKSDLDVLAQACCLLQTNDQQALFCPSKVTLPNCVSSLLASASLKEGRP